MNIPQMEKMSREDIIDYMRKCAKQYVPEWRYDKKQPDAGTALVSIFADMMYDNIKKFNMSVAGDLFSFFDGINAKLLPASPAEGFVVFGLPEGFVSEAEVPSGTRLLADGDKEQLVFETQEEVLVCPLDIHKIFLAAPREDAIYELFDPQKDGNPSFFLFQDRAENLQRHLLVFCFGQELKIASHADARLSFWLRRFVILPVFVFITVQEKNFGILQTARIGKVHFIFRFQAANRELPLWRTMHRRSLSLVT